MTNVAFIGLGIMGSPMAVHLQTGSHQVSGYNKPHDRSAALVAAGGRKADSIADAVAVGSGRGHQLGDDRTDGQHDTGLAGGRGDDAHVLVVQVDAEAGSE